MKITITELRPQPRLVYGNQAPRFKRNSEVQPSEFAILQHKNGLTAHASEGKQPLSLKLHADDTMLLLDRVMDAYLSVENCAFANSSGAEGMVAFWTRLRLVPGDPQQHPLLKRISGTLSPEGFMDSLAQVIESAIGRELEQCLAGFQYEPLCQHALTRFVAPFHTQENIRNVLYQRSGLVILDPLTVTAASAHSLDASWKNAEVKRMQDEQRRRELQEAMAEASVGSAKARLAHQEALIQEQEKLERERLELEQQRQREEVRIALELLEQQAEAEARAARAEAEKREAEAELERRRIALTEAEIARMQQDIALKEKMAETARNAADAHGQQLAAMDQHVRMMGLEVKTVNEKLSVLETALAQLQAHGVPGKDGALSLAAQWRAYNMTGIIKPQLAPADTLPTGTMLDVAVTTSKDAYIYILLKDASGKWISLVPDAANLMGITRDNRQTANSVVVWPAENRRRPDLPYWMLDPHTGFERLLVIASLDPFDPLEEIRREGERAARAWSRGICNPVDMLPASPGADPHTGIMDYQRALRVLTGQGRICHEMVVCHV